jgi:hemoglobin
MTSNPHYQRIGGEPAVRQLVERFYAHMDVLSETKAVRQMHPADLTLAKEKLFLFLSGWLGGPQLYLEKYGHPKLRARHMPFTIGEAERDQWMLCMRLALQDLDISHEVRAELESAFFRTADFMRNQQPS